MQYFCFQFLNFQLSLKHVYFMVKNLLLAPVCIVKQQALMAQGMLKGFSPLGVGNSASKSFGKIVVTFTGKI